MVHLSCRLLATPKEFIKKSSKKTNFLDYLRIYCIAGNGGDGMYKLGGIGGQGGDVVMRARRSASFAQLLASRRNMRFVSNNGEKSHYRALVGEDASKLYVNVPTGVSAYLDDKTFIGEVNEVDDEVVICRGGEGGSTSNGFMGKKGQCHHVMLYLKLMADVGLVGFPNAGKSTLLSVLSAARPKIASYPFTTLRPQLGHVQYKDLRTISVADLPGLVEGASSNVGLGHQFLRHVERTKIIILVVDLEGFRLNPLAKHRSPIDTVLLLNKELELYDKSLLKKPSILIFNKKDTQLGANNLEEAMMLAQNYQEYVADFEEESLRPTQTLSFAKIMAISAEKQMQLGSIRVALREMLDKLEAEKLEDQLQSAKELIDFHHTEHMGGLKIV